jgi:hypothetical protein
MLKIPKYLPQTLLLLLFISFNNIVKADIRQVISVGGGKVTAGNETLVYTLGQPFISPTSWPPLQTGFVFPLESGSSESPASCDTTLEEWTCVEFQGLKPSYKIGDLIQIEVNINVKVKRFERVDLWIAIAFPSGDLFFKTDFLINSFTPTPKVFKESLETMEMTHRIVDLELAPGLGGIFTFYALYVDEGTNPLEHALDEIKRSELVINQSTLANE